MQSWRTWRVKGNYCLLCTLRPLVRPAERTFTTTSSLQRAKRAQKKHSRKLEKPLSSNRILKEKVGARDFVAAVTSVLHEFKQNLDESDPVLAGWERFERYILTACKIEDRTTGGKWGPLRHVKMSLLNAFLQSGRPGLRDEVEFLLQADNLSSKYSTPNLEQQKKVADLRYPAEWYPQARSMQRTIHLHVGPTNSGKTYHALKRLEACNKGFYAGPLRLLAQEVFHRFKAQGAPCSLITGDEVNIAEGGTAKITSNTVEMVSLGEQFDVGVIDEIQMIADSKRGWAWTRAVLGSRATELHLCGETRAVPLIKKLAALTGDKLEIHHYQRLNPLKVMNQSLQGDLRKLEKGDCLVSFSRVHIHALKAEIEKSTGRRAAIVYGGLPAEIRTQQASLFNDPDNDYDFLVASDAIGMGLNLSCKRIIFETSVKRLPEGLIRLSVPEIKQIGGRAGRYRTAAQTKTKNDKSKEQNVGLVTSMEDIDLPYIQEAMDTEPPPLHAAGIFPPDPVFQKFAAYFPPNVPFEYIIKRLLDVSQVHPLFFMCDPRSQIENAQLIDNVEGLRIEDQLTLMAAPMYIRDRTLLDVTTAFARCVAEHTDGRLLDIPELNLEVLEKPVSGNKDYLNDLESLHKAVILYSWLSFRFGGVFTDRTLAAHVKGLVEERMVRALTEFSANKKLRKDASLHRQIALQKQMQQRDRLLAQSELASEEGQQMPVDLSADEDDVEIPEPEAQAV